MEHNDLICDTDLNFLESIIKSVCPMLLDKIHQFKAQNCKLQEITQQLRRNTVTFIYYHLFDSFFQLKSAYIDS